MFFTWFIREYTRQQESNFEEFCSSLEKEHRLLSQAAYQSETENAHLAEIPNYLSYDANNYNDAASIISDSNTTYMLNAVNNNGENDELRPQFDRSELLKQKYWYSANLDKQAFDSWNNDITDIATAIHKISSKSSNNDNNNESQSPNDPNLANNVNIQEENEQIAKFVLNSIELTDKPQLRNPIELDHSHELKIQIPLKKDGTLDNDYINDMFIHNIGATRSKKDSIISNNNSINGMIGSPNIVSNLSNNQINSNGLNQTSLNTPVLAPLRRDHSNGSNRSLNNTTNNNTSNNNNTNGNNSRPSSARSVESGRSMERRNQTSLRRTKVDENVFIDVIDEELEMFDMDDDDEFMDDDINEREEEIMNEDALMEDLAIEQMDQLKMDNRNFDNTASDEDIDNIDVVVDERFACIYLCVAF